MTLAVDFDGVIHAYSRGWHDGSIYDDPIPGALDGLQELMNRDAVFIFTTRDTHQVVPWLLDHGIPAVEDADPFRSFWNGRGEVLVTNRKLAAHAYLDDRAVRFTDWPTALTQMGTT